LRTRITGRTIMNSHQHDELTRRGFLGRTLGTAAAGALLCTSTRAAPTATSAERPASGWQIGCWTRPWAKYEYAVALDAVAEAGFKYIAFTGAKTNSGRVIAPSTPIDEASRIGEETAKRGLQITYVYGGGLPLHEGPDGLRRMIDNCEAAGGWSVSLAHIGNQAQLDGNCRVIADCCDYAAEKNVEIVIKPHGGLNGTGPLCRQAVEKVGHKNFSILYDPCNICYYSDGKLDPVDDAATVDGLVTGICVKDYRHPKQVMLTPGTGQIDLPAVLKRLKKGGLTHGVLAIECLDPGTLPETLKEAIEARRFVEELVGKI
jgi:sugar phosphate isomerase/epimerase